VTTALENKILVFIGLILSVCTLHQSATENFTGLRTYAFAWRTNNLAIYKPQAKGAGIE
jgi:hypothetical protein